MDCLGVMAGVAVLVDSPEAVPVAPESTLKPLLFLAPELERGLSLGSQRLLPLSELRPLPSVPAVLALPALAAEDVRGGTDETRAASEP